jgi:hypothetical protein
MRARHSEEDWEEAGLLTVHAFSSEVSSEEEKTRTIVKDGVMGSRSNPDFTNPVPLLMVLCFCSWVEI